MVRVHVAWPENQQFKFVDKKIEIEHKREDLGAKRKAATLGHSDDVDSITGLSDEHMRHWLGTEADDLDTTWSAIPDSHDPTPRTPQPLGDLPTSSRSPLRLATAADYRPTNDFVGPTPRVDEDPRIDDSYKQLMMQLIVSIHKSNTDWVKKQREYSIAAAKLKNHGMCKESEVLKRLNILLANGAFMDKALQQIEEKDALGLYVTPEQQTQAKKHITSIVDCIKECAKIKLYCEVKTVDSGSDACLV